MDLNSESNIEVKRMIEIIIQPETILERSIVSNKDFVAGLIWGKPRKGHPEGEVIYHIGHVLNNINKYSNSENRYKLRLIALIHDTFKYKVNSELPKSKENNHAFFAYKFAEKYIEDKDVLQVILLHDEAFNSWSEGNNTGDWISANHRVDHLIEMLSTNIILYLLFYQCDNETGNKNAECFTWFSNLVMHKKI